MIGILYSRPMLRQLIQGRHSFEKPVFYLEAANRTGKEIIFFSLQDINWAERRVHCWNGKQPAPLIRDLPPVVINRTRTSSEYSIKMIKRLKNIGIVIINEHNVVSKLEIHRILSTNATLLPYLPATSPVSYQSVKRMLEQYSNLFLKPVTASVGKGIIRIRKVSSGTVAEFNIVGRTKRKKASVQQIVRMINKQKSEYLVQQGITLMKYKGKLVDFRVSVQKDGHGNWQCTGVVGRIATKGAVVTNIHCGGKPLKASEVFKYWNWNSSDIEAKIADLGIRIGETLDQHLPLIADIGLDIATRTFDEQAGQYRYQYKQGDNTVVFWAETTETVLARVELAKKYDLAGVAAWRLGYEDEKLWEAMLKLKEQ